MKTIKDDEGFLRRCFYYYQTRDIKIENKAMDEFIFSLKEADRDYKEENFHFPIAVEAKSTLVFIPKDEPKRDQNGAEYCDVLLFNPENAIYARLKTQLGFQQIFSKNNISTSCFIMDGFMCIHVFDSAFLDIDPIREMFLYLEEKSSTYYAAEQYELMIQGAPELFALLD